MFDLHSLRIMFQFISKPVSPAAFDLLNLHCFDAGLVQVGNGRVVTRARYFIIDQLEWLPVFWKATEK